MANDTYCMLIVTRHAFSNKYDTVVDLGQQNVSTEYSDSLKELTSDVDALNYMASKGWELVNSYANQGLIEVRHIMRKKQ